MIEMIIRRFGQAALSLLAAAALVFLLTRLTGDPINFLLSMEASDSEIARVREQLGLDQPLPAQFWAFLGTLASGNLGISFRLGVPVTELIGQRLPTTVVLAGAALLLVVVVAVPLGIYSAHRRGGILDRFARFIAAFGQATPAFWLALLLILVFSVRLGWLPPGGQSGIQALILPAVAIAFEPIARLTRLLRSSMIEELGTNHVTFLRIKGLSEHRILWQHALRNAGLTALTFFGLLSVSLLLGSVLVETVFSWPGVGRLLVESIHYRDFNVVQGLVFMMAAAFIIVNLVVDLLYMALDPKLRTKPTK